MKVSYDKLKLELNKINETLRSFEDRTGLSQASMKAIRTNDIISFEDLETICEVYQLMPEQIITYQLESKTPFDIFFIQG